MNREQAEKLINKHIQPGGLTAAVLEAHAQGVVEGKTAAVFESLNQRYPNALGQLAANNRVVEAETEINNLQTALTNRIKENNLLMRQVADLEEREIQLRDTLHHYVDLAVSSSKTKNLFGDLCAVIFGDGGHHQELVGDDDALAHAISAWSKLVAERDRLRFRIDDAAVGFYPVPTTPGGVFKMRRESIEAAGLVGKYVALVALEEGELE